jgi:L-threonylcarbamoyladenylate synthase
VTNNSLLSADEEANVSKAAAVLKNDGVIIHPTETVYGFAANAFSIMAIRRVDQIKKRKAKESFLLLVKSMEMAKNIGVVFDETSTKLASRFWPGPLSLVLPTKKKSAIEHLYVDGTLAIRVSPDPFVKQLFDKIDFPIISTSANISGEPIITTPDKLDSEFKERVDLILTRGVIKGSKPSSIVSVKDNVVSIIREGAIPEGLIYAV